MQPRRPSVPRVAAILPAILVSLFSVSSHAIRQAPSTGSLHLQVPDGFVIERIAGPELLSYPMFGVQDERGRLFVFEHNPLNPLTRHAVNTCAFDEHAKLVLAPAMRRRALEAGFPSATVRYRIFFPNALRRLRPLETKLAWLPLGAQYYVMAQKSR